MNKLPLCESLGCIAKNDKCTDLCRAAIGCPDELHEYFETPDKLVKELRNQFQPVQIEPCTDRKWSEYPEDPDRPDSWAPESYRED